MARIEERMDDETVNALKSLSKKLMPSENLCLTKEEALAVMKLSEHRRLPNNVVKHFLARLSASE